MAVADDVAGDFVSAVRMRGADTVQAMLIQETRNSCVQLLMRWWEEKCSVAGAAESRIRLVEVPAEYSHWRRKQAWEAMQAPEAEGRLE